MTPRELPKRYIPADFEDSIRERWNQSGAFHADPDRVLTGERPPYAILIPPPNVTARLHLGHALNNSLQDILIRAHRMRGYETLWMPGTDHAGIATQTVVDKRLQAEGQPSLKDYKKQEAEHPDADPNTGRAAFIAKVQQWKDEYEATITDQLQRMGCSCDWQRQRFTMDDICARAVREAFFRLFRDGLIYRGKRLVNWDPVSQTALADDEVEMREIDGSFYYLRYPLVHATTPPGGTGPGGTGPGGTGLGGTGLGGTGLGGTGLGGTGLRPVSRPPSPPPPPSPKTLNQPLIPITWGELAARGYPGADDHPADSQAWITVATTRPETYLGDTAVAINPSDPRATPLDGLLAEIPLVGRTVPIVRDDYVVMPDPEGDDPKAKFATGFLKVTPAHDPNDWDLGHRHAEEIRARCSAGELVINIMAPDASISQQHGWSDYNDHHGARVFIGKSREEARTLVITEFRNRGLLEDIKPYRHAVGHSYRTHVPIEPYLSDQWYCKVTDDRLRGWAQRALPPEQRTNTSSGSTGLRPVSPSDEASSGGTGLRPVSSSINTTTALKIQSPPGFSPRDPYPPGEPSPNDLIMRVRNLPHVELTGATYFVTWRLRQGNLTEDERTMVLDAMSHWHNQRAQIFALCVMPDHVHCIIRPHDDYSLGDWVASVKKHSALRINRSRKTSGPLWQDERFDHIVRDQVWFEAFLRYVLNNPVEEGLCPSPQAYPWLRVQESINLILEQATVRKAGTPSPPPQESERHPSETGATKEAAARTTDATMRFHPERYARTYETWHDNLRDWCISRQLWWGHRIPVWHGIVKSSPTHPGVAGTAGSIGLDQILRGENPGAWLRTYDEQGNELDPEDILEIHNDPEADTASYHAYICFLDESDPSARYLEENGFTQDPDVLDTWFSSALWPLSTLGWPDPDQSEQTRDLLRAFNPTSVLTTAREIITLWVSRMVMFNRYFLATDATPHDSTQPGPPPFEDVFIHAMIQDGEGRKMSKSLGNGVDPLDIIESHGTDALRFTLCQMTTQTQDVRMPVEHDPATGKNTSPKFDLGRNFVTKLWNATRFALMNLQEPPQVEPVDPESLPLIDRWMLSRLATATRASNHALRDYQFSAYAQTLYDLMWRDFCDWYLEAIKPTVKESPAQRAVLRQTIETIIRLLHPICPYVTEAIYDQLRHIQPGHINGLTLDHSGTHHTGDPLLCAEGWPEADESLINPSTEAAFDRMREILEAIRQARAARKIKDRTPAVLHAPQRIIDDLQAAGSVAATLANLNDMTTLPPDAEPYDPATAIQFQFATDQLHLSGVVEAADPEKERAELTTTIQRLDKDIATLEKRLANPGYTEKAPLHMVEETRNNLAQKQAERQAAEQRLTALT